MGVEDKITKIRIIENNEKNRKIVNDILEKNKDVLDANMGISFACIDMIHEFEGTGSIDKLIDESCMKILADIAELGKEYDFKEPKSMLLFRLIVLNHCSLTLMINMARITDGKKFDYGEDDAK